MLWDGTGKEWNCSVIYKYSPNTAGQADRGGEERKRDFAEGIVMMGESDNLGNSPEAPQTPLGRNSRKSFPCLLAHQKR